MSHWWFVFRVAVFRDRTAKSDCSYSCKEVKTQNTTCFVVEVRAADRLGSISLNRIGKEFAPLQFMRHSLELPLFKGNNTLQKFLMMKLCHTAGIDIYSSILHVSFSRGILHRQIFPQKL